MVLPPDHSLSKKTSCMIANRVNPPGCTVEITRINYPNGLMSTTEVRETLRFTRVIIKNSKGQIKQEKSNRVYVK